MGKHTYISNSSFVNKEETLISQETLLLVCVCVHTGMCISSTNLIKEETTMLPLIQKELLLNGQAVVIPKAAVQLYFTEEDWGQRF